MKQNTYYINTNTKTTNAICHSRRRKSIKHVSRSKSKNKKQE